MCVYLGLIWFWVYVSVYRCNWTLFVIPNATFIGNASGFQWQLYVNRYQRLIKIISMLLSAHCLFLVVSGEHLSLYRWVIDYKMCTVHKVSHILLEGKSINKQNLQYPQQQQQQQSSILFHLLISWLCAQSALMFWTIGCDDVGQHIELQTMKTLLFTIYAILDLARIFRLNRKNHNFLCENKNFH